MGQQEQIEKLEKFLHDAQGIIKTLTVQSSDTDDVFSSSPVTQTQVSNTVSKPRSFEEIEMLRNSVGNFYAGRLHKRQKELDQLRGINGYFEDTGVLDLPSDMRHVEDIWTLFMDLLEQYCLDMEDILVFGSRS